MLLQSLRAYCKAPGEPGSIWKDLEALVRATGESRRFACGFQTDLHFADGDMLLTFTEFLCWSIQHMSPECRPLFHEGSNALNRIVAEETCVIIFVKVVWMVQTSVTHFTRFPRVDAHHIRHFIQPFE